MQRILVPLDGSALAECVLPHTIAIAHALNAQVYLLQVVDQPATVEMMNCVDPISWRLKKTEADLYLNGIKTRLESSGLVVEKDLLEGPATEQIMQFAQEKAVDLMILSSYDQYEQGSGSWNVSSTVRQVLQRGTISTLLVRATQSIASTSDDLHYQRILVPLDGSRRAESVMPIATMLAQFNQAELLLAHIVNAPEMARRMPLTPEDTELSRRVVECNQAAITQYLARLQEHIPIQSRTLLQVSDTVAEALQDVVEHEQIDLMILNAHGYSGSTRWPYGNITSRFIINGTTTLLMIQDLPMKAIEMPELEAVARVPGR
ncbi:MAG: universal stress protein [Aggregatilineales bacterium]